MKIVRSTAALSCTAVLAGLLAGSAYAKNDNYYVDNMSSPNMASTSAAPQPSFGTRTAVIDAESHVRLTVAQDGSVSPDSVGMAREDSVAFHVTNTSAQPVNVVIEGEGAATVSIGQVGGHQEANFAWRFDSWKAVPRVLKVGQTSVKLYLSTPRSMN